MTRDVRLRHPIHVGAVPAYGWQDITTDRTVMPAGLDRVLVAFNADAWPGRLEGSYRFVVQGIGITRHATGEFITFDFQADTESWRFRAPIPLC